MMMQTFWPTIQDFLTQYPHHEHRKQWRHWMKEGLTPTTDLAAAKIILNLSTLDQIYLLFHDSPALHGFFEITWDHKINYCRKDLLLTPTHNNVTQLANDSILSSTPDSLASPTPANVHFVDLTDPHTTFSIFHQDVYHLFHCEHLQCILPHEPCHVRQTWRYEGLRSDTEFTDILAILNITSVHAYLSIMRQFSIFTTAVTLCWSEPNGGFHYTINEKSPEPITSASLKLPSMPEADSNIAYCLKRIETRLSVLERRTEQTDDQVHASAKLLVAQELDNLNGQIQRKSNQFRHLMNQTVDESLHDVFMAANDGLHAMMKATDDILAKIQQSATAISNFMPHIPTLTGCREAINEFMPHLPKLQTYLDQLQSPQADARTVALQPLPM